MAARLSRILLYVRDIEATARFYQTFFGLTAEPDPDGRIVELASPEGGTILMLHQAAKSQKQGQTAVKLLFDVEEVEAFREACLARGLAFGPVHEADGYRFANAKDPDQNSISISSRAFRDGHRPA